MPVRAYELFLGLGLGVVRASFREFALDHTHAHVRVHAYILTNTFHKSVLVKADISSALPV